MNKSKRQCSRHVTIHNHPRRPLVLQPGRPVFPTLSSLLCIHVQAIASLSKATKMAATLLQECFAIANAQVSPWLEKRESLGSHAGTLGSCSRFAPSTSHTHARAPWHSRTASMVSLSSGELRSRNGVVESAARYQLNESNDFEPN